MTFRPGARATVTGAASGIGRATAERLLADGVSVLAKTGTTLEAAPYASTKAAILSLTRAFAFALRERPVRVNAILPGIVDTPMQDAVLERIADVRGTTVEALDWARLEGGWLGRAAPADECAGVICFLLSEEAAYMTGQGINFTGGLVTW